MSVLKTISQTIVVACAIASPLHAQAPTTETPVTIWDAFSLENFLKFVIQSTMPSLRALADIRYDQIDVDPVRNRIALIGADIRPFLPYIDNDGCVITADALVFSGQPVDRQQGFALSFALDGVVVDFDCLPREARPVIGLMGVEDIRMDRATLDVNYDFASGGATLHLGADFDDLASLSGSADLDYISYRLNLGSEDVMPAADINHIQVTLEDRGLFAAASRVAPPGMLDPEGLAQIIPEALAEVFREMNGVEAGDLSPEQQAFISQAVQVAQEFVAKPSQIVLETAQPDVPVRIDETDLENPKALFSKLAFVISTTPKAIATGISSTELQQAMDGQLSTQRFLDVGRALLTGIGAPRNHPLGLNLLDPLAREGNSQASALMAVALQNTDPCLLYTSPSPRDLSTSRMPSSA